MYKLQQLKWSQNRLTKATKFHEPMKTNITNDGDDITLYFSRLLSADEAVTNNMSCSIVNKITIADKRLERIQIKIAEK